MKIVYYVFGLRKNVRTPCGLRAHLRVRGNVRRNESTGICCIILTYEVIIITYEVIIITYEVI